MAPKLILFASTIGVTIIFCIYLCNQSGSSIQENETLLFSCVITSILSFFSFISFVVFHLLKKNTIRNFLSILFICTLLASIIPIQYSKYRVAHTKSTLLKVFNTLSLKEKAFPKNYTDIEHMFPKKHLLIAHGYTLSSDKKYFELFYRNGSDSYVLKYPVQEWVWKGAHYQQSNINF